MLCRNLLTLGVKSSSTLIINLQTIATDVALASFGIAGDDTRQSYKASGILRPTLKDGEPVQREVFFADDFFTRAGGNRLRKELSHFRQHWQHLHFVEKTLRGFHVHEVANAVGDLVERIDLERQVHAARGAELVDQKLMTGMTLDVLKEEGWAGRRFPDAIRLASVARPHRRDVCAYVAFAHAICDLGDLENWIDFGAYSSQLAGVVEGSDPATQVVVGQMIPRSE